MNTATATAPATPHVINIPTGAVMIATQDTEEVEEDPAVLAQRAHEQALSEIKLNGYALKNVKELLRTPELCMIAVEQEGHAIKFVPPALRTPEIVNAAASQNGFVLGYLTAPEMTQEALLCAVRRNGHAIKYVPKELRTVQICQEAVAQNPHSILHMTAQERTIDVCWTAVAKQPNSKALLALLDVDKSEAAENFALNNWNIMVRDCGAEMAAELEIKCFAQESREAPAPRGN